MDVFVFALKMEDVSPGSIASCEWPEDVSRLAHMTASDNSGNRFMAIKMPDGSLKIGPYNA